ncbi:MAG: CoB--CoM heterodisulfide reductase iron-sulfur subunit A family protein [Bacillota bacterium]|nr:CoB--CoM heterodisulfide reductase iron-sulfur subunit A family protein [Bacillota bacterium]
MARGNGEAPVVGAAMVIGAGVGGIQAALDLGDAGLKVYLVERQPAIGGRMAQLDKTFPTNDCSMCTLAPRLVDCDRHPNITVLTDTEVRSVRGEVGNFKVRLRRRARYVDIEKCKGCGDCEAACPIEVVDEFDEGLSRRKAIFRPYAQAVPNAFAIDITHCPECEECTQACSAGAIDPFMWDTEVELSVGALIVSPGYDLFDPRQRPEFGYGQYPNVVTSLQFERMLSASGPTGGHLVRPSNGREPRRIAFIQCVGSRDVAGGQEYCSAVCCMYTAKQAVVAAEHLPEVETAVFCADVRAFGKGFEGYYRRALEQGVRYVRSLISTVKEAPHSRNLLLRYHAPGGGYVEEEFDLVVLALGLRPAAGVRELARAAGFALNEYGFAETWELFPGLTSRPGVFAGGVLTGPKDIPETVVEASAAAANVSRLLAPARGSLTARKVYPPERDVSREEPRIGVFVCHCGLNIGSVVDVPELVRRAAGLPGVVWTEEFLFACSQDSIGRIAERVREQDLNRVVVASCTPRTHAPLFQSGLREAGLNPSLYEHVNLREHVAWVHRQEPERATEKGWDLVRMAVGKARLLKPVTTRFTPVEPRALVVGGGAAGMTAALALADQGFPVTLVERDQLLGGNLLRLARTLAGGDPQALLFDLTARVERHPGIEVLTGSTVDAVGGYTGRFRTLVRQGDMVREITHGVAILATGAAEYRPRGEYLYGAHPGVITQTELEGRLNAGRVRGVGRVVMIQCVGSRDGERPYCSRVCCGQAVKNALHLKELSPRIGVVVLYRDMRTYGFQERYYRRAREKGVLFIRYDSDRMPSVAEGGDGKLVVRAYDPVLEAELALDADLVVLGTGVVPRPDAQELARLFRVPLTPEGFFAEAHAKLRPVDFPTEGLYLCGMAHAPKTLSESISQAQAAAMRAVTLLARGELESERNIVTVDPERCTGCGICVPVCPYGAREVDRERGISVVHEVLCRGCGSCVAACPSGACQQQGFEDGQIFAMIDAALGCEV